MSVHSSVVEWGSLWITKDNPITQTVLRTWKPDSYFFSYKKNYFFYCGDYNIVTSFSLSFPPSEPSYIPLLFSFKVMASGYIMYSLYNVLLCMFLGLLTWYWIVKWCALPWGWFLLKYNYNVKVKFYGFLTVNEQLVADDSACFYFQHLGGRRGKSLWIQCQSDLHSEFQANQYYIMRLFCPMKNIIKTNYGAGDNSSASKVCAV